MTAINIDSWGERIGSRPSERASQGARELGDVPSAAALALALALARPSPHLTSPTKQASDDQANGIASPGASPGACSAQRERALRRPPQWRHGEFSYQRKPRVLQEAAPLWLCSGSALALLWLGYAPVQMAHSGRAGQKSINIIFCAL